MRPRFSVATGRYAAFLRFVWLPIGFTFARFVGTFFRASSFSDSFRNAGCGRAECGLSSEGVTVFAPEVFLIGVELPLAVLRPETFAMVHLILGRMPR